MKLIFTLLVAMLLAASSFAQTSNVYFTSFPTLTPDGGTIIFSYESDLWKVPVSGGNATRLTAMQGAETRPRVSPDGQWLAFSATEGGNDDVYVMPLNGGPIRQLTYHSSSDQVESWSWDSETIYFESGQQNGGTTYTVALDGGTPRRMFGHYFNRIHSVAEAPNGDLYFNDTWESDNQATRKGYKGEFNPDIQYYNPKTKAYKRLTDYLGKDMWATIDRSGTVYFVSDEGNGQYNLYTFKEGKKTPLTHFPEAIKHPQVSADGRKVVFEKGYQLWQYDVATKQSTLVPLVLPQNLTLPKLQDFDVKSKISAFDVAPDNKKLAFVSRGALFVSDKEGKFVQQLNTRPEERVLEVKWLADSLTLLYSQTVNGYANWFTQTADGKGQEKQITTDQQGNRHLTLNDKLTQAVYLSGRNEVRLMDLKTLISTTVANEELWAFQNDVPSFSANGEYIAFTAHRDFEREIYLYHIKDKKLINLTKSGVSEGEPTWSPDGKYLYFVSDLLKPNYPFGSDKTKIYRLPLTKMDEPFRGEEFEKLFEKEDKKDDKKEEDEKGKGKKKKENKDTKKEDEKPFVTMALDTVDIMERLEQIGPDFGAQENVAVVQKDDKTYILYVSNHEEGKEALWRTTLEPFEEPKTEKVADGISSYDLVRADKSYYLLAGGVIRTLDLEGGKTKDIAVDYTFRKNLKDEFRQMYYEAWAGVEENFYSGDFHGTDWQAMRDNYAKYLPYLTDREDFRTLFNDMLGELNASHLGFYTRGDEEEVFYENATMESGLLFDPAQPYRVARIVKRSALDKEKKSVKPGDLLLEVNGETVDTTRNRDYYFTKPSRDDEMKLTFRRAGADTNYTVRLHPQSSLSGNLYDEWQDWNQRYVDEKSKNRIAYVHMKNMGMGEYEDFVKDMTRDWYNKEALILDLRYNTGGNVHDLVLQFLSQKPYLKWKYRGGAFTLQPNFGVAAKPIVMLINEQSLSDAEMTATGFKALKLGKVIGTETYRWIIFTSGKGLVDGSFFRLPSWGCYTLDGDDIEKEGVKPDIYVKQTFVQRLADEDPQLDRAIAEIMGELK
ncbi:S41 family peptidase [Persicitalea jodogahamensis]|uniref:Tricorn protease homolog n=1 Tax=Persicitalea jodogahamensis TaxID=402147 RepID=A0A8J3GA25_9BACT|nr:S41 family peptidase [Persicitalea jodogahamensis]GHB71126.1 tricorn protease [Persicitalea jodogahamensis]